MMENKTTNPEDLKQILQPGPRRIPTHDDFKKTAFNIYSVLKKGLGFQAGYVALLSKDEINNDLLFLDAGDLPCSVDPSLPMPIRGLRAEAYRTGQVVLENDFSSSPWVEYLPPKHAPLENVLFAPMKIGRKTIGVLGLANKPGGFSAEDARLAETFGALGAIALAHVTHLEQLHSSEAHFRAIAQSAQDAIITTDGDGSILFWNPSAAGLFGYGETEAVGRPVTFIIPEQLRERHCTAMKRTRVTGIFHLVGKIVETTGLHRDGHEFPVELSLSQWEAEGNVRFTAILRDISRRKTSEEELRRARTDLEEKVHERTRELTEATRKLEAEVAGHRGALAALAESERKFRAIFNQTFQFIGLLDPEGRILEVNETTLDFIGREYDQVVGTPLWDLNPGQTPPQAKNRIQKGVREAAQGRFVRFEFPMPVATGEIRTIDFSLKPVFNDQGQVEMLIPEGRDITIHKQAESALRESEARLRLLSTEVLLAQENERKRVAKELHDGIGQYLSAIKYRVEHALLQEERNPDTGRTVESLRDLVPVIQQTIEEIRRICLDLRPSILDDLGILATLSWFTRDFQETYKNFRVDQEITIEEKRIPDLLKTVIFRIVQEAFNNVAKHSEARTIRLKLEEENEELILEIDDDGRGFNPDRRAVRKGKSGGLGLTSMQERVELSGGRYQVRSGDGEGTRIQATWPVGRTDAG